MMSAGPLRSVLRHLPLLVFGRPLHGRARYRPFFIVGSGRCGSTLLRAVLEAHDTVHIPPENDLGHVVQAWRRYSRLPWHVVLRIVLGQFAFHPQWDRWELSLNPLFLQLQQSPRDARDLAAVLDALYRAHTALRKPSATRWGDKTPVNVFRLNALASVFPDLRVIHALRDGRDVVASFMRVHGLDLARGAALWLGAVRAALAFGARHPTQYLEIRYEDLVHEPRATIQRVATFLDLPFDERMLRHHELDLRLGDVERIAYLQGVRQPIHTAAVGRWRTELTAGQLADLDRRLGPTLAQLGY